LTIPSLKSLTTPMKTPEPDGWYYRPQKIPRYKPPVAGPASLPSFRTPSFRVHYPLASSKQMTSSLPPNLKAYADYKLTPSSSYKITADSRPYTTYSPPTDYSLNIDYKLDYDYKYTPYSYTTDIPYTPPPPPPVWPKIGGALLFPGGLRGFGYGGEYGRYRRKINPILSAEKALDKIFKPKSKKRKKLRR